MKSVLVIRHFDKVGEHLSEAGRMQARAFGRRLKSEGWVFSRNISSGIPRSNETVGIILEELGLTEREIETEKRLYFPAPDWDQWNKCKEHPQFEDRLGTFLRLWPDFTRTQGETLLRVIQDILISLGDDECALCIGHSPFLPAAAWIVTSLIEETDFGEGFLFKLEGGKIRCSKFV